MCWWSDVRRRKYKSTRSKFWTWIFVGEGRWLPLPRSQRRRGDPGLRRNDQAGCNQGRLWQPHRHSPNDCGGRRMFSNWIISYICIFRPSPRWGSLSLVGWTRVHRAAEVKEAALRQKWCKAAMASWFPYLEVLIPVNDEPLEIPMRNNWIWCKGKKEPTIVLIQCQFYDWPTLVNFVRRRDAWNYD